MSLGYKVWSEEDVKNRNVVADGEYPFEITAIVKKPTQQKFDKEGKPLPIHQMLEIDFEFWDDNGVTRKLRDWIVLSEGMDWKLRHLASSTDTLGLYESQALDCHHLLKKKGLFILGTRTYKDKYGKEKKGNNVKDYVKKLTQNSNFGISSLSSIPIHDTTFNDDIPPNL